VVYGMEMKKDQLQQNCKKIFLKTSFEKFHITIF